MKIKFLKSKEQLKLSFILSDASFELANSIRRAMIADVPVMAIDEVHISDNNSALFDEVLALRLGLVPLTTDLKSYNLKSDCKCRGKGCDKCTVKLMLEKQGPGMVYSGDLKSSDPRIKPVIPDIPIIKLFDNQAIKLEADAILGFGRDHAKWTACMATYRYYPKIKINKNCYQATKVCPRGVYDIKNRQLIIKDLEACDLCLACVDECSEGSVEVSPDNNKFIFDIESWGQLSPSELLKQAVKALKSKVNAFKDAVR